jgi:hypothetical protein
VAAATDAGAFGIEARCRAERAGSRGERRENLRGEASSKSPSWSLQAWIFSTIHAPSAAGGRSGRRLWPGRLELEVGEPLLGQRAVSSANSSSSTVQSSCGGGTKSSGNGIDMEADDCILVRMRDVNDERAQSNP